LTAKSQSIDLWGKGLGENTRNTVCG